MNRQTKQAGILALAILAAAAVPANAAVTLVKSRAAMDGNDLINWAQLGKPIATPIIFTGQFAPVGSISIAFATPVSAVGAQMGYNDEFTPTSFTEVITAYDFDGNLLGTFTVTGEENTDANNSAVFVGIKDSIPEISTVMFSTTTVTGPDPGAIAINNVTLVVPAGCETNRR